MSTLAFNPAPIPPHQLESWQQSGRTLTHALNPAFSCEVGAFVTKKDGSLTSAGMRTPAHGERAVFFGKWDRIPGHLLSLYTESYTFFHSLQQIAAASNLPPADNPYPYLLSTHTDVPSPSQINFYSRVTSLYVQLLRQTLLIPTLTPVEQAHWSAITQIFHLAKILYLPEDGRGDGVVGEELLDWVNMADVGPTVEEGEEILGWNDGNGSTHPEFWSYLIRTLLRGFIPSASRFLTLLKTHPSPVLSTLFDKLATIVLSYPRSSSSSYQTEQAFIRAHVNWREKLSKITQPLHTRGWALQGNWGSPTEASALEESVDAVLSILNGKPERVLEESVDWKEALGAWGVWVRPALKRDDLPDTIRTIAAGPLALDRELGEDAVMEALLSGDITQVIVSMNKLSIWLATHLTDLMEKLGLIDQPADQARTLRDHFVLEYAMHLGSGEGLWRMTVDYLKTCGEEGRRRAARVLERVSLENETGGIDEDLVEEVFKTLQSLGLEEESRTLSRVVGQRMIQSKQYGVAVAYCIRAGDGRRLGIISDQILNVYVRKGSKEFVDHVNSIPPSLFSPDSPHYLTDPSSLYAEDANSINPTYPVLASKLSFLPLYRDFLDAFAGGEKVKAADLLMRMFASGVAPKAFWAVLLVDSVTLLDDQDELAIPSEDAYELLRHLEEIVTGSSHSPADYLAYLVELQSSRPSDSSSSKSSTAVARARPLVNGQRIEGSKLTEKEAWAAALKGLEVVRLSLARYLASDVLV